MLQEVEAPGVQQAWLSVVLVWQLCPSVLARLRLYEGLKPLDVAVMNGAQHGKHPGDGRGF